MQRSFINNYFLQQCKKHVNIKYIRKNRMYLPTCKCDNNYCLKAYLKCRKNFKEETLNK